MNDRSPNDAGFHRRLVLGVVGLLAAVLTKVWPDWIEGVFRVDPDHGNGSVELAVVVVLLAVSLVGFASAWALRRGLTDT